MYKFRYCSECERVSLVIYMDGVQVCANCGKELELIREHEEVYEA